MFSLSSSGSGTSYILSVMMTTILNYLLSMDKCHMFVSRRSVSPGCYDISNSSGMSSAYGAQRSILGCLEFCKGSKYFGVTVS